MDYPLYWFRKVAAVGSPLGSITLPAISIYIVLQYQALNPIRQLLVTPKIEEPLLQHWGYLAMPDIVMAHKLYSWVGHGYSGKIAEVVCVCKD